MSELFSPVLLVPGVLNPQPFKFCCPFPLQSGCTPVARSPIGTTPDEIDVTVRLGTSNSKIIVG